MNFPYSLEDDSDEHIPRGGYNYIWQYLPERLRVMLYCVFKEGFRFETIEWYDAVLEYKAMLSAHEFEDEEAYKVFPKMDYQKTAEAVIDTHDFIKPKSFTKSPFVGIDNSNNNAGSNNNDNLLATNKPNLTGSSGRSTGAYVPRQQGAVASSQDDKKKENSGLFGKFKRGLFN